MAMIDQPMIYRQFFKKRFSGLRTKSVAASSRARFDVGHNASYKGAVIWGPGDHWPPLETVGARY
jgi:hypothetical protein